MTTKQLVCGHFSFLTPLSCLSTICNKTYDIQIDGIEGKILFPIYPEHVGNTRNRELISPYETIHFYRDKERTKLLDWGEVYDFETKVVIIKMAIIELEIEDDELHEKSKLIYSRFNSWVQLFDCYTKLIYKQGTSRGVTVKNETNLNMYKFEDRNLSLIQDTNTHEIILHGDPYGKRIDESFIERVCQLASLGKQPKLEYVMLIEAYAARSKSDNRKAIIEAASALEICLTNRITEEFKLRNIEFGDELLKKFPMLGKRFELCNILGIQLPTRDYKTLIIDPRNKVVHKSYFPNNQDADKLIEEVEKYLRAFSPNLYQE